MFDTLKNFLAEFSGATTKRDFAEDDYRLAAAALLIHLAEADGTVGPAEKKGLKEIIARNFGLDEKDTAQLLASAEQSDHEAVDFYHFTNVIKHALDEDGRLKIIEMMWEIAYADGHVDELEDNIVWRIAELLGVSGRDRVNLRHRVAAEPHGESGAPAGPWTTAEE
jgi:uncharacterized tellurite resistance protein B-like protein